MIIQYEESTKSLFCLFNLAADEGLVLEIRGIRRFFLVIFITRRTLELRPATANFVKVKKAQLKNPKPRRGL